MFYVGLDVHVRSIAGWILNADGKRVKEFSLQGDVSRLLAELQLVKGKLRVCYDSGIESLHTVSLCKQGRKGRSILPRPVNR